MYIANSRVRHFRNYLRFINICNSNQHLCSATCHILSVSGQAMTLLPHQTVFELKPYKHRQILPCIYCK